MDWRHAGRETMCLQEYERCARLKSKAERPDVQTVNPEYQRWFSSVEFLSTIIPGTSHTLRLFWVGPYQVSRLIAPVLAEIKPVYYPREEKFVSQDVLKLYRGEEVICQDPEDRDPNGWLNEGELTELPEAPLGEGGDEIPRTIPRPEKLEIPPEPDLEIQVIPENPEEKTVEKR